MYLKFVLSFSFSERYYIHQSWNFVILSAAYNITAKNQVQGYVVNNYHDKNSKVKEYQF